MSCRHWWENDICLQNFESILAVIGQNMSDIIDIVVHSVNDPQCGFLTIYMTCSIIHQYWKAQQVRKVLLNFYTVHSRYLNTPVNQWMTKLLTGGLLCQELDRANITFSSLLIITTFPTCLSVGIFKMQLQLCPYQLCYFIKYLISKQLTIDWVITDVIYRFRWDF